MSIDFKRTPRLDTYSNHKLALVTFAAIWLMVHFIPPLIDRFVPASDLVREMLAVGIIVAIMSYVITPLMVRYLHGWLSR